VEYNVPSLTLKFPGFNPKGIAAFSPGLRGTSYPGFQRQKHHNSERVASISGLAHSEAMPQSLAKILVHTVFSTKDRRPFLREKPLREELHRYLGGIPARLDCQPILVGGVDDHVHLLCALSRTREAAAMVKEAKRGPTPWLKAKGPEWQDFAWQNGYGMFSPGFSQIGSVRDYISCQEEHHRKTSFQDELRQLLRRYEITFDERYVWD
jgi:putative transposase